MKAEEAARAFADEVAEVIDELRDLVKKAEKKADTYLGNWVAAKHEFGKRVKELTAQRDELLAAAKAYLEREPPYPKTSYLGEMRIKLEAVIEKVEKNA